jgi:VWFA-related protein
MRLVIGLALAGCVWGQTPPQVAETTTKEEPATFKARVNLVMVPVVVRDRLGRAIGTLKQEDFQLLDKGKPQLITRFSLEKPGNGSGKPGKGAPKTADPAAALEAPQRYVAYLFDDVHLRFEDLARVRDAAWTHIRDSLGASDRAAIYSTSGQTESEFTDDKDRLRGTLFTLAPRPVARSIMQDCPDVGYYMGDLIYNHNDTMALNAATSEAMACAHLDANSRSAAESMARAAASRAIAAGGHETRLALGMVRDVIRRMASTPGQRVVILASPGFLTMEDHQETSELLDRAIKASVTINTLDARGLWVEGMDMSRQVYDLDSSRIKAQYEHSANTANADVLAELAYGTGGTFFQNNNDLAEGYRKIGDVPQYMYVLGFSPQNLKLDGSYHSLKVTLRTGAGLTANARRGYYAPRHLSDPVETAKEEIREAIFSREEIRELPVELHSQFFKPSNETARVTVVAQVDLKGLKFRKTDDARNADELTIAAVVFDHNGNFVTGVQKVVSMRLKDETLAARQTSGITVRSTFDVKPGGYLIRLVVRDAEGQLMTAQNGAVDIP